MDIQTLVTALNGEFVGGSAQAFVDGERVTLATTNNGVMSLTVAGAAEAAKLEETKPAKKRATRKAPPPVTTEQSEPTVSV